ncbi:MAG: three-Cys-motif partner protein TcmP [Candidatus Thorarchaeota archaeon]
MVRLDDHISDLKFPLHTKEKLDIIEYYYKIWFKIVSKRQNAYIIDTHAGTGYNKIDDRKRPGSAILAVDLFKEKANFDFELFLNQKSNEQSELLRNNIENHIQDNNISVSINENIFFFKDDWKNVINEILERTRNGIRFCFIDPIGIKSVPWIEIKNVFKEGKDEFDNKESGFEVLLNWAWHKIVRDLGYYFKARTAGILDENDPFFTNLNNFFGPVRWMETVSKYPNNIFDDNREDLINNLSNDLLMEYSKMIFNYFKYISIHPVHYRKKSGLTNVQYRGKIKYFLIFATNYREAYEIIDYKFCESRGIEVFRKGQDPQQSILKWCNIEKENAQIAKNVKHQTIEDKIDLLKKELDIELYPNNELIIKHLYRRGNYDYGNFEIYIQKDTGIKKDEFSLSFLKDNNIIDEKPKRSKKTGTILKFWYLTHPLLVDRSEYMFIDGIKYRFCNDKYTKC